MLLRTVHGEMPEHIHATQIITPIIFLCLEFTNGFLQFNTNMTQSFYLNQDIGIQFGYETKERENWDRKDDIFRAVGNYYF